MLKKENQEQEQVDTELNEVVSKEIIMPEMDTKTAGYTKSRTNKKLVRESFNYEDIISQTKEISVNLKRTELEQIQENSRREEEVLENKLAIQESLSNKDVVAIDSHENYNTVVSGSQRNYDRIMNRNTTFTIKDMAIQTQLYMYETEKLNINKIEHTIKTFVLNVFEKISKGTPIILNPILIFDTIVFDRSKILPIAVANPKLLPPIGVLEWTNLVDKEFASRIIDTFIHLLEGALSNGHEVQFFDETVLTRNHDGVTSLYISVEAAKVFNAAVEGEIPQPIPFEE